MVKECWKQKHPSNRRKGALLSEIMSGKASESSGDATREKMSPSLLSERARGIIQSWSLRSFFPNDMTEQNEEVETPSGMGPM